MNLKLLFLLHLLFPVISPKPFITKYLGRLINIYSKSFKKAHPLLTICYFIICFFLLSVVVSRIWAYIKSVLERRRNNRLDREAYEPFVHYHAL